MIKGNPNIPFYVLFGVYWVLFLCVGLGYADDIRLGAMAREDGVWQSTVYIWQTWSTRFLVELVTFACYIPHTIVWRTLQALTVALVAYSLSRLLCKRPSRKTNWLVCGVVCIYPMADMLSAGWIATTCLYWWTLALFLYSLIPWKKYFAGEKVSPHSYVLSILAVFYAVFAEQLTALAAGFVLLAFAWII